MSIPWEKVLVDPLGFSGYALFLVFGVVTVVVKQKKPANKWIVPAGFTLAAVCVIGGLLLAYHHETIAAGPAPSMHIDEIHQEVGSGSAVAGVQGDVTTTTAPAPSVKTSQHKDQVKP